MGLFNFLKPKTELELMIEEAKNQAKKNQTDALYQFEHVNFRSLFYHACDQFVLGLLNEDNLAFKVYSKACGNLNKPIEYQPNQFILSAFINSKHEIIFKLLLPEPKNMSLCFMIYIIVDSNGLPINYLTLEKDLGSNPPMLCGWDKNGKHLNYGSRTLDDLGYGPFIKEIDLTNAKSLDDLIKQSNN